MTSPNPSPVRRQVRAQPRLSRGPKTRSGGAGFRHPNEHAAAVSTLTQDGSSQPKPSGAPPAFDWTTAKTLSVKEAAFRLSKSVDTVRYWLRVGRLRGWQIGGLCCSILVSEESVEQVLRGAAEIGGKRRPRQRQ